MKDSLLGSWGLLRSLRLGGGLLLCGGLGSLGFGCSL
jgi:hypothetical protein